MKTIGSLILAITILALSGGLSTLSTAFSKAATLNTVLNQAANVSR